MDGRMGGVKETGLVAGREGILELPLYSDIMRYVNPHSLMFGSIKEVSVSFFLLFKVFIISYNSGEIQGLFCPIHFLIQSITATILLPALICVFFRNAEK